MNTVTFLENSTYMLIFWLVIAVVLAVIEGMTLGMVTIWFTVGAVVAAAVSFAGCSFQVQLICFLVVSVVLLIFTRPLLQTRLKVGHEKNQVDNIIGKVGLVTEAVEPFQSGLAKVNGIIWTAIAEAPEIGIAAGSRIKVVRVEGVKLIVRLAEPNEM
ncbi:MAG: NfeD family protein [Clostridiales Family XIII bacterium]|jgi:membrane protein implicated in regulation of membrane protease activity|nr:NfeD family protein [Clostridiales Family XIII bacterium]